MRIDKDKDSMSCGVKRCRSRSDIIFGSQIAKAKWGTDGEVGLCSEHWRKLCEEDEREFKKKGK